jgi:general stress protein 26
MQPGRGSFAANAGHANRIGSTCRRYASGRSGTDAAAPGDDVLLGMTTSTERSTYSADQLKPVAEALRNIDICMLTTRTDGGLHTRPMSNNRQVEYDGDTWFFAFRDSWLAREVEADPRIALGYAVNDKGVWLAMEADATLVDDEAEKRKRWFDDLDRWFKNGPDDPNVTLIRAAATRIRSWGATGDLDLQANEA